MKIPDFLNAFTAEEKNFLSQPSIIGHPHELLMMSAPIMDPHQ